MADGKLIEFNAKDNITPVTKVMGKSVEELSNATNKGTSESLKLTKELNKESEKRISLLEREKAAIKSILDLGKSKKDVDNINSHVDRWFSGKPSESNRELSNLSKLNSVIDPKSNEQATISKLQEILEAINRTSEEGQETVKKTSEEESKYFDKNKNLINADDIKDRRSLSVYGEDGKKIPGKYYHPHPEEKHEQDQKGAGVFGLIQSGVGGGINGILSNLEHGTKELISKHDEEKGGGGWLGTLSKIAIIGTLFELFKEGKDVKKEQNVGNTLIDVADTSEAKKAIEREKLSLWNIERKKNDVGGFTQEFALKEKHLQELERVESGKASLFYVTGKGFIDEDKLRENEKYGYSIAESLTIGKEVARNKGTSENIEEAISARMFAEKAGVSGGTISGFENLTRFSQIDGDMSSDITKIAGIGGLEKLNENTAETVELLKRSVGAQERINISAGVNMIETFAKVDSPLFQNAETRSGIMSHIENSMKNPKNDFMRAKMFAMTAKRFPNASYSQIMEQMEAPFSREGAFQDLLDMDRKMFGNDDEKRIIGLQNETGLHWSEARAIIQKENKNRGMYSKTTLGGTNNFDEVLNKLDVSGATTTEQQDIAKNQNNWYKSLESASTGMDNLTKSADELKKRLDKIAEEKLKKEIANPYHPNIKPITD